MKKDAKPFPTLLTKSDAMLFAAEGLEKVLADMELVAVLGEVLLKPDMRPTDPDGQAAFDSLRTAMSGVVDLEIQKKAMEEAADEIRSLANEAKLADARAATKGIKA